MPIRIKIKLFSLVFCLVAALLSGLGCDRRTALTPGQNSPTSTPGQSSAPSSSEAKAIFTDMTSVSGVKFKHSNSRTPMKYLIEIMGSGAACIDYDGDGWQDLIFVNCTRLAGAIDVVGRPTLKLYRNNHDGTFTDKTVAAGLDKTDSYGMGIAVGDYDNDGNEDFYVSSALGGGHLFHNDGKGRFTDVTQSAGVANMGKWGASCAWVDCDNDGKLDLFVCNYVKYGSLKDDQPCFADGGKKRIYCIPSAYYTSFCTLFHNEGNGKFKDVTQESGIAKGKGKSLGVAVWDYDHDGKPDLFVSNDTVAGFLFHNLGNMKFEEVGIEANIALDEDGKPHSGMGIDTGDLRNDGKTSLVITNYQGVQTSLYRESGTGLFSDVHLDSGTAGETGKVLGFGVTLFDYDNDGFKDILQANGHVQDDVEDRERGVTFKQPTLLFHNQMDGKFVEVGLKSGTPFSKPIVGRGCIYGDLLNRGVLDIVMTENNGDAMLWKNEVRNGNHWVALKLIGTKSNRDGIGALVTSKSGGVTQSDMVRSGSSYLSQSDLRAHFGLGKETLTDVEVRWPSGTVDKIVGLSADRIYTLKEGTGKAEIGKP